MLEKLISLMGGRAGEMIAMNDISTGASNDLEVAMGIARDMITKYGMNENVGPMSLNLDDKPYEHLQLLGDNIENEIGNEIRKLLDTAYAQAQSILNEHRDKLDIVASLLLEKEKISEEEFNSIFEI
jgi:cell division protease FtsH